MLDGQTGYYILEASAQVSHSKPCWKNSKTEITGDTEKYFPENTNRLLIQL